MSIVCFSLEWTREVPAKLLFFSPAHGTMTKDSYLLLMSQTMVCAVKDLIYVTTCISTYGRRGGLMVSVLDSGASAPGSSPGRGHCVVFLGKTLY